MRIHQASLPKRVIAAFLDGLSTLFVAGCFFAFIAVPVINHPLGGAAIADEFRDIQLASHLFTEDTDTSTSEATFGPVNEEDYPYAIYAYYVQSDVVPEPLTVDQFYDDILGRGSADCLFDFTAAIDPSAPWTIAYPEANTDAVADFYVDAFQGALDDLTTNDRYTELAAQLERFYVIGVLLSLLGGALVIFCVVPPFFKNGETLGKKALGIALTNSLGYKITKAQVVFRGINEVIFHVFGTLILLSFISFLVMVFSKKHVSIPDYMAGTQVIDVRDSLIYQNAAEEQAYDAAVAAQIAREKADRQAYFESLKKEPGHDGGSSES